MRMALKRVRCVKTACPASWHSALASRRMALEEEEVREIRAPRILRARARRGPPTVCRVCWSDQAKRGPDLFQGPVPLRYPPPRTFLTFPLSYSSFLLLLPVISPPLPSSPPSPPAFRFVLALPARPAPFPPSAFSSYAVSLPMFSVARSDSGAFRRSGSHLADRAPHDDAMRAASPHEAPQWGKGGMGGLGGGEGE